MSKEGKRHRKHRISRISFCEWGSESFRHFNQGGLICENCNFNRTRNIKSPDDKYKDYQMNNKVERDFSCPNCGSKEHWHHLPPIARVPKKNAPKKVWSKFWEDLKARRFNHPKNGCI